MRGRHPFVFWHRRTDCSCFKAVREREEMHSDVVLRQGNPFTVV